MRGTELSPDLVLVIELPSGGELRFDSLADAAEAGYPVGCQWFVGCENEATELVKHPILKEVPTCSKHAAWVAANR